MTETVAAPPFVSVTIGFVVFFLGAFLARRVAFLRNYSIPEPVSGGLAVALLVWAWFGVSGQEIQFDLAVRDELLVIFFACIGLNARIADLFAGGRQLVILLGLTLAFMVLQNVVGLIGAVGFDLPKAAGVLLGSASLIGGHATAIAWGPTIETEADFAAAAEIGVAAATLGLIFAALIGGPIAKFLITRRRLWPEPSDGLVVGLPYREETWVDDVVNHVSLMRSLLAAHVAVILGYVANEAIAAAGFKLPLFVPCLIAGIILSNTVPHLFPSLPWPARTRALAVVSDYCLSVFIAMSLMSMQLWTLTGLGGPLLVVLSLQVVITVAFIVFFFFRAMGASYDAAVLSSGFAGFALGATPTAIANMSAVTKRYGAAPTAFIILPLVSAFFVDIANAVVIRVFVGL
ncbi:MAG: sodium/glutamate symporter [Inquilinaceae bacterium]